MKRERLAEEIFKRHRIPLDADDPILFIGEIASVVMEDAKKSFMEAQTDALNQMEALLVGAENSAKKINETIITQGSEWMTKEFREAGALFVSQAKTAAAEIQEGKNQTRRYTYITMGLAFATVCLLMVDLITR